MGSSLFPVTVANVTLEGCAVQRHADPTTCFGLRVVISDSKHANLGYGIMTRQQYITDVLAAELLPFL